MAKWGLWFSKLAFAFLEWLGHVLWVAVGWLMRLVRLKK